VSDLFTPQVTEASYTSARALDTGARHWSGAEVYGQDRNLVAPALTVVLDTVDMSAFLYELSGDTITFVGPPSVVESVDQGLVYARITSGNLPIYTGILVRSDSRAYANVRQVSFSMLTLSRYFDVDLSELDLTTMPNVPTSELQYLELIMQAAGFRGEFYLDAGAAFRNINFWTLPTGGPGFTLSEVISTYWNPDLGSSWNIAQTVAQANMLDLYELPDGDVLISPIVPHADRTVKELINSFQSGMPGASIPGARIYCDDGAGRFVNDPRLDIQNVSLALDEGFAEVEVEAFSNDVNVTWKKGNATFVQNGEQRRFFDRLMPAYTTDSTSAGWPTGRGGFPPQPWPFQRLEGSPAAPKAVIVPRDQFRQTGMSLGPSAIDNSQYDRYGIGGSRTISYRKLELDRLDVAIPDDTERTAAKALFNNTINDATIVCYGFRAGATGFWGAGTTFRFTVKVPEVDTARLKIEPLIGRFTPEFGPKWFPVLEETVARLKTMKPRKARRVQNQFVATIGAQYATMVPAAVTASAFQTEVGGVYYDVIREAAGNQLATWLTCKELMRSRQVELRFAGAHSWVPNSFVAIARRPPGGEGMPIVWYDLLWVLDAPKVSGRVNGELYTTVNCGYVGGYNTLNDETVYDMPLSWAAIYDLRGAGFSSTTTPIQPVWTPNSVPNLELWLDASHSDSFVLTATNQVLRWRSQVTPFYEFYPASSTASTRPTRTATQNGLSTLSFARASSQRLVSALPKEDWAWLSDGSVYTILAVLRPGVSSDPNLLYGVMGNNAQSQSNTGFTLALDDRSSANRSGAALHHVSHNGTRAVLNVANAMMPFNRWSIVRLQATPAHVGAASRSLLHRSDSSQTANNSDTSAPDGGDPSFALHLGSDGTGNYYDGQIAELLIYRGTLTLANRDLLQQHLASKWDSPLQTVLVSDTFTAANGTGLNERLASPTNEGHPWYTFGTAGVQISSNRAVQTGNGIGGAVVFTSSEQFSITADVNLANHASGWVGILTRYSGNAYQYMRFNASTQAIEMVTFNGSTHTVNGSKAVSLTAGTTYRVRVLSTQNRIVAEINGIGYGLPTTTYYGSTLAGMVFGGNQGQWLDNIRIMSL
jgi:hypothetical protein